MKDINARILQIGLLIIVLSMAGLLVILSKKRDSIYNYKVDQDYIYNFDRSTASTYEAVFKNGEVRLQMDLVENSTVFLELDIKSSFLGRFFQPSIMVVNDDTSFIQYFEYGARGTRYINVSSLKTNDTGFVKLIGKRITIEKQTIVINAFEDIDLEQSRILLIAPHPDDAEIAAFGLYSSNLIPYVVTITAGEAGLLNYGKFSFDEMSKSLIKGRLRTWNSITIPLLGGVPFSNILNLGFFDGTLYNMFLDTANTVNSQFTENSDIDVFREQNISGLGARLSGESDWSSLVENIGYLLDTIKPDVIVTPYPALETHNDHKYSSIAVFEAIKEAEIETGFLFLYAVHNIQSGYFPFGYEGGIVSLPPNFSEDTYFQSLYSHNLSTAVQEMKHFALEANTDIRFPSSNNLFYVLMKEKIKSILGIENSFYHKAVRSNELFFVVPVTDIYNDSILSCIMGI